MRQGALTMSSEETVNNDSAIESVRDELASSSPSMRRRVLEKFIMAALGAIPWIGGFISAAMDLKIEDREIREDNLQTRWLDEHRRKFGSLSKALNDIALRFESLGDQINERIQSDEYLDLVRRAFRAWDRADTDEKRKYVANLVSNASGTTLCSDDVVRLFIDWLDKYHEAHFAVIREIYQNPDCTRYHIWNSIHGETPREDSAEADLFRLLIRDLSTGGVIRQRRATTANGQFLKKTRAKKKVSHQEQWNPPLKTRNHMC